MSSSLAPSGTYAVGATTFVLPVRPVRNIGRARVRRESGDGTEPALQLEDVVFTAFYPTDPTTFADKKHEHGLFWMIRWVSFHSNSNTDDGFWSRVPWYPTLRHHLVVQIFSKPLFELTLV